MRASRLSALLIAVAVAFTATACSEAPSSSGSTSGAAAVHQGGAVEDRHRQFHHDRGGHQQRHCDDLRGAGAGRLDGREGEEPANWSSASSSTSPGLGLQGADGTMSGFDIEVAKYIAKRARCQESRHRVEGNPVRRAGERDQDPAGRHDRRHLLDHRQPQEGRRLRRPVLPGPPGPAGQVGQQQHLRAERPQRQAALLRQGLDVGAEDQGLLRHRRAAAGVRRVLRLRPGAEVRRGRRSDHR